MNLYLVVVVTELGHNHFETLSLSDILADLVGRRSFLEHITVDDLPVREDHLRKGLSRGVGTKEVCETKTFKDGEEGLNLAQRSSWALFSSLNDTTTLIQSGVHTRHGTLRNGDITHVERLQQGRTRLDLTGVDGALGGRHDLTSTTMDSISVHSNISESEANSTKCFLADDTSASSLEKGTNNGVFDFVEVLHTLGTVNNDVGDTIGRTTEGPDLTSLTDVPAVVIGEVTSTSFLVLVHGAH